MRVEDLSAKQDRLREEHELQVNNLSSKIGELQKRLDTSGH